MADMPLADPGHTLWLIGELQTGCTLLFLDSQIIRAILDGQLNGWHLGIGSHGELGSTRWIWIRKCMLMDQEMPVTGDATNRVCTVHVMGADDNTTTPFNIGYSAIEANEVMLVIRTERDSREEVELELELWSGNPTTGESLSGVFVCYTPRE